MPKNDLREVQNRSDIRRARPKLSDPLHTFNKSLKKAKSWLEDQNRCRKKASSRSIEKHSGIWPSGQNPLCFAGRRGAVTAQSRRLEKHKGF